MLYGTPSFYSIHLPPDLFKALGEDKGIKKNQKFLGCITIKKDKEGVVLEANDSTSIWILFKDKLMVSSGIDKSKEYKKPHDGCEIPRSEREKKTQDFVNALVKELTN